MRYTIAYKLQALEAILRGIFEEGCTVQEACSAWKCSPEEFYDWVRAYQLMGKRGLKVGSLHAYRKDLQDGKASIFPPSVSGIKR